MTVQSRLRTAERSNNPVSNEIVVVDSTTRQCAESRTSRLIGGRRFPQPDVPDVANADCTARIGIKAWGPFPSSVRLFPFCRRVQRARLPETSLNVAGLDEKLRFLSSLS